MGHFETGCTKLLLITWFFPNSPVWLLIPYAMVAPNSSYTLPNMGFRKILSIDINEFEAKHGWGLFPFLSASKCPLTDKDINPEAHTGLAAARYERVVWERCVIWHSEGRHNSLKFFRVFNLEKYISDICMSQMADWRGNEVSAFMRATTVLFCSKPQSHVHSNYIAVQYILCFGVRNQSVFIIHVNISSVSIYTELLSNTSLNQNDNRSTYVFRT